MTLTLVEYTSGIAIQTHANQCKVTLLSAFSHCHKFLSYVMLR